MLNSVLWSRDIIINRKKIINKTIPENSLLYGAEAWTLNKTNERKLLTTNIDFWRRQQEYPDWKGKLTPQFEIC